MAIMIDSGLWPSTAATLTASSSDGMDSRMSTIRITRVSTQPPKAPASRPSSAPPSSPRLVDTTPMISDWRAPKTQLGQQVRAERVQAQRVSRRRAGHVGWGDLADPLAAGRLVRGEHRRQYRDQHERRDDDRPDDRAGVAPQPLERALPQAGPAPRSGRSSARQRLRRARGHSRPPLPGRLRPGVRGLHRWRVDSTADWRVKTRHGGVFAPSRDPEVANARRADHRVLSLGSMTP